MKGPALRTALLLLAALASVAVTTAPLAAAPVEAQRPVLVPPVPLSSERFERSGVFKKDSPEDLADLIEIEQRLQAVVPKMIKSTVGVRIGRAQGSGVIVSRDGYVLTAAHVIGGAGKDAVITLPDGTEVKGRTLGLNRRVDAGLIKIDGGPYTSCELGDLKEVRVGDWCVASGHPGGFRDDRPAVVRLGRIVLVRESVIQSDCTLVGGDSGGPLFDVDGRVIGINSRIGRPTSWNFHVPVSAYTQDWDRLVRSEEWGAPGRALMGVNGEDHPRGCRVTDAVEGYPAARAGIRAGDVITRFDGKPVTGFDDLVDLVAKKSPGDAVTVEILRDGETIEKKLVLARRR